MHHVERIGCHHLQEEGWDSDSGTRTNIDNQLEPTLNGTWLQPTLEISSLTWLTTYTQHTLRRISIAMFSDELKAFRRLGFRHVCPTVSRLLRITDFVTRVPTRPLYLSLLACLAPAPSPQLRLRHGVRPHVMERPRAVLKHGVPDCSCP
jgi:hypothetical protein